MALQDPCCPVYPDDWVCEKMDQILGQYQHSPKLKAFIQAGLEQLDVIRCVIAKDCERTFDCTQASDAELDAIGLMVGFPRFHCNVICDPCAPLGMSDYSLDDDLYCRFIQAQLITNKGGCSLSNIEEAIVALWGDDAAVVYSGGGSVAVWPGRELTDIEKRLYGLYRKVLPLCLGVNLVIYDSGAVISAWCCGNQSWCDVSMGCELQDCTRLDPARRVGPICPEENTVIDCEEFITDSYTSDIFAFSQNTDVYPGFPVSLSFMGLPAWASAVDNGDGTFTVSYTPPEGNGSASFMVMAKTCPDTDLESSCTAQFTLVCVGNNDPVPPPDLTVDCGGSLNEPPVAPANITVDCGNTNAGPIAPPDVTIDCGNTSEGAAPVADYSARTIGWVYDGVDAPNPSYDNKPVSAYFSGSITHYEFNANNVTRTSGDSLAAFMSALSFNPATGVITVAQYTMPTAIGVYEGLLVRACNANGCSSDITITCNLMGIP